MEEYIYRILHIPTGLFYTSIKGRWNDTKTNLSNKGNFYTSLKIAENVYNSDCNRSYINKSQTEKYNLPMLGDGKWSYNYAYKDQFRIVKYLIQPVDMD